MRLVMAGDEQGRNRRRPSSLGCARRKNSSAAALSPAASMACTTFSRRSLPPSPVIAGRCEVTIPQLDPFGLRGITLRPCGRHGSARPARRRPHCKGPARRPQPASPFAVPGIGRGLPGKGVVSRSSMASSRAITSALPAKLPHRSGVLGEDPCGAHDHLPGAQPLSSPHQRSHQQDQCDNGQQIEEIGPR